jgi:signal peptidase
MKIIKIIYYAFLALLFSAVLLLVVSAIPITGNVKILAVLSGSMEPAIHTGSVVIVMPAEDYKIGDVITFGEISKTKTPTTHRINDIKITGGQPIYITKGDANNMPDSREVQKGEVAGKVLFSVPYAGYAVNAVRKPVGFMAIVLIPSAMIITDEAIKIKKEIAKKKEKPAEIEKKEENKNV